MKTFILVTAALLAVSGVGLSASVSNEVEVDPRGIIEDLINSTFNKLLSNLTDTINVDAFSVDFDDGDVSEYISGGLNVSNLRLSGVKSLVATNIQLNILSRDITLALRLSEIIASFKYWADFELLQLIPLYGSGRMNVVLDDLELAIKGKADLSGGIKLTNLNVLLSLGETTFDLNGLIDNPEFSALVSNALNDNFSNFINDNAEVLSTIISPIVETVINAVLAG